MNGTDINQLMGVILHCLKWLDRASYNFGICFRSDVMDVWIFLTTKNIPHSCKLSVPSCNISWIWFHDYIRKNHFFGCIFWNHNGCQNFGLWLSMVCFLHEASFGLRVLSLPASVCVSVCVCMCVYQSLACPRDDLGPVESSITKFGSKMQNTLVKVSIVF